MAQESLASIECTTIKDLRAWLAKNHARTESVWLIYYKPATGIGDITYAGLVDELLCYGWIDSLPRKIDGKRTSIRISPRNPKSNWSKVNKEKVARLTTEGRMRAPGMRVVALAKKTGVWDALNDVENLVVPVELRSALHANKLIRVWEGISRTRKRGWLERLFNAKSDATRQKRIDEIVNDLSEQADSQAGQAAT